MKRIFLSPPHMGGLELDFVKRAFASNYIAPLGPQVDQFESEFAALVGTRYAVAVSSGTAGLHLALKYLNVCDGDEVVCSTFTFAASANSILYQKGIPVFVDSDSKSWNINPDLLEDCLNKKKKCGRLPKAVMVVHLYGQAAEMDKINEICNRYNIPIVEDAAEALGAQYCGKSPGSFGKLGVFSFNGNKIITTSGGGMVVSDDEDAIRKVRFWATQARDFAVHYQHSELGYNYRMSNVLAAIGLGQLRVLTERVEQKRALFTKYQDALGDLPGVHFMPEARFCRSTRWLTCLTVDPEQSGTSRDEIIAVLEQNNIESRPTWKPMHLQPLYAGYEMFGGEISEKIFKNGLCLPSGTSMTDGDVTRIIHLIRDQFSPKRR